MSWPAALVRLEQAEVWRDAQGREHDVGDIDPDYAGNIVGFLERQANRLHIRVVLDHGALLDGPLGPRGDMARDDAEREHDDLLHRDPLEWLHDQRLVRRLVGIRDGGTP